MHLPGIKEEPNTPDLEAAECRLAIVYRPLDELKLDPKNPRSHSRRQIRQIADSISTFGFNVPVALDGVNIANSRWPPAK